MSIFELIRKNRSYRRFYESYELDLSTVFELVDLARLSPTARNDQPLKYIISCDSPTNMEIFSTLSWAGFLKDWEGPEEGERPAGYIIMLHDTQITKNIDCDHGIAAQSILLGAVEKGLGGCILGSVNRDTLRQKFNIDDSLEIIQVIALGKPQEEVVIESVNEKGDTRYWRDENQIHHVPKRELEDIVIAAY